MFSKISDRDSLGYPILYDSGIDAGVVASENDTNTVFYLYNSLEDTARGVTTNAVITNSGVSIDGNGDLDFDGASRLTVPYTSEGLQDAYDGGEVTLDFDIIHTTGAMWQIGIPGSWNNVFVLTGDSTPRVWIAGIAIYLGTSSTVKKQLTFERWLDGTTWKISFYIDGTLDSTTTTGASGWGTANADLTIGYSAIIGTYLTGKLNKVRVSNKARYKGVSF